MISDNEHGWEDYKTRRDRMEEPLFSIDWVDACIMLGFTLFFVGILMKII